MSKSSDKLLVGEVLLQGIGSLISWNAILSSLDWYNNQFFEYQPAFWIPLLNFLPGILFQPLTIKYGHLYTFNTRIVVSYIIIASILILTPIIVELAPGFVGFLIICILTVVMGSANAVGQTSVFGLAGTMPEKFTNMVMLGNGLSGLTIALIRLICLFTFPQNPTGYLLSTTVYFIIAGATLIVCSIAQIHMMKNPIVIQCLSNTNSKEARNGQPLLNTELDSFRDSEGYRKKSKADVEYKVLISKIWQHLFLIWLNYVITFGMLTHVALATEGSGLDYPVFVVLMILIFNMFDVLGRYTPVVFMVSNLTKLWIMVILRFFFWFTFMMIASDAPSMPPRALFGGLWFKMINMAVYAYTNGSCSTFIMILGPSRAPDESKDKAGYTMVTGLLSGIFSGQLLSMVFLGVGHVPS